MLYLSRVRNVSSVNLFLCCSQTFLVSQLWISYVWFAVARYISGKTDVSLCADSSPNPPDKSVHQMEDGKQQTDQKKFSCTEPGRRDPRRY